MIPRLAFSLLFLSTALFGCAPAVSSGKGAQSAGPELAGSQATDFTLRDTEGRNVRLSDYLGKQAVLIDFWATWCVPCEAELPHLESLYEENREKGFVVLGVAMDGPETVAQVAPFSRRYNLQFPVLLDEETKVVGIYNPKRTAPLSVLINKQGQIVRVRSGYSAGDEKMIADEVAAILK